MGSRGYFGIGPGGNINHAPPTTETMLGLIHLLSDTGGQLGAALVTGAFASERHGRGERTTGTGLRTKGIKSMSEQILPHL